MTELELELRDLGTALAYPETPDLARAARRRLAADRPRRPFRVSRRTLAIALAVLALAIGAAMAVPQARTAILDFIGLRGVKVTFVDKLPAVPKQQGGLYLGERTTLEHARELVRHDLLLPRLDGLDKPDEVWIDESRPGQPVSFVYGSSERPRLLLSEFRGTPLIQKLVQPNTGVEQLTLDGTPAIWLSGEPHEFFYLDEQGEHVAESIRLAGNTLLWERGQLTVRLEGRLSKEQALRIARSMR